MNDIDEAEKPIANDSPTSKTLQKLNKSLEAVENHTKAVTMEMLGSNVETIHHIQIFIISAIQRFLFVPKSTHRDPTRDSAERQHEKQH